VFCLIDVLAHGLEAPFLLDFLDEGCIDGQVAEWGGVLVTRGCCGAGEVVVVGGTEQEDALAALMVSDGHMCECYGEVYAFAQSALL